MTSRRTREAAFLLVPALLALIGVASVATAKTGEFRAGPVAGVAVGLTVFLAMNVAMRLRAPHADPYLLPLVATLVTVGLATPRRPCSLA